MKDAGEPQLQRQATKAEAASNYGGGSYISLTEADYEMLADYEEEYQRRGNFEVLFPTAKNIDEYKGYLI